MLIGKKICLRAIEDDDLALLTEWRNDPHIYKNFYEHEPLSLYMQTKWLEKVRNKNDEKYWIIESIKEKKAIGTVGLLNIDWRNRHAELGRVLVLPELQGRGLGKEMICLLLRHFFDHMNMNRLYCDTYIENKKAIEFYKKIGFFQEGVFRDHIFMSGKYCDICCLSMIASEYHSEETQTLIKKYIY